MVLTLLPVGPHVQRKMTHVSRETKDEPSALPPPSGFGATGRCAAPGGRELFDPQILSTLRNSATAPMAFQTRIFTDENRTSRQDAKAQKFLTAKHLARLTPQPKMIATKERKDRRDITLSLCVPCVFSRQKFAQENKTFYDSSTEKRRFLLNPQPPAAP